MTRYVSVAAKTSVVAFLALSMGACSLTRTERTALTGGAIGGALGTGIAAAAGGPLAAGALVGAGAGAISGVAFEQRKKKRRRRY